MEMWPDTLRLSMLPVRKCYLPLQYKYALLSKWTWASCRELKSRSSGHELIYFERSLNPLRINFTDLISMTHKPRLHVFTPSAVCKEMFNEKGELEERVMWTMFTYGFCYCCLKKENEKKKCYHNKGAPKESWMLHRLWYTRGHSHLCFSDLHIAEIDFSPSICSKTFLCHLADAAVGLCQVTLEPSILISIT